MKLIKLNPRHDNRIGINLLGDILSNSLSHQYKLKANIRMLFGIHSQMCLDFYTIRYKVKDF